MAMEVQMSSPAEINRTGQMFSGDRNSEAIAPGRSTCEPPINLMYPYFVKPTSEMDFILYPRVDFLNKKRKFQVEPVGLPLPKHVRWGQVLEYDSSSDSTKKPRKISELEPNSINDLHSNLEYSTVFTCHKDVADLGYPKTRASNGTSSSFSGGIKGRSITKPTSGESETLSKYSEHLLGFGIRSDFGYLDYADYKELENLLNSSGIDPSDYVLSSGRWSGGGKKLTIDEEFEKCFAMLML